MLGILKKPNTIQTISAYMDSSCMFGKSERKKPSFSDMFLKPIFSEDRPSNSASFF